MNYDIANGALEPGAYLYDEVMHPTGLAKRHGLMKSPIERLRIVYDTSAANNNKSRGDT